MGDPTATVKPGVHAGIAHETRSTSLFGGRRVVSVTHADSLNFGKAPKRRKKAAPASAKDPLELLVSSLPTEGNLPIVLILQAVRFDRRKRAFKVLHSNNQNLGGPVRLTQVAATTGS